MVHNRDYNSDFNLPDILLNNKQMKKILIIFFLAILSGISLMAQSPWNGFWKPINRALFLPVETIDRDLRVDETTSFWLFRPQISLAAMKLTFSGDSKIFDMESFSAMGLGISYSHFVSVNNLPYNNFSINGTLLFDTKLTEIEPLKISPLISITAYRYLNLGIGFDFGVNKLFILTGINWNFNQ